MARIILVALFVLAVSAQRAPLQSCAPANPFLSHMVELGMRTYESPKFGVSMCGTEFAQFGTCCDETRIKEYVQKDKTTIQQATDQIVQEFEHFMGTTSHILHLAKIVLNLKKRILKKFSDLRSEQIGRKLQVGLTPAVSRAETGLVDQNAPPTPTSSAISIKKGWATGSKGKFSLKESCKRRVSNQVQGTDPLEIVKPLRSQIQILEKMNKDLAFRLGTQQCWNQIANIRSSSVCSTCSGRSHIFFRKDKALMSEEVCVAILDKCYKPLRQLTFFVSVLNLIPKLLGIESKTSITTPQGQKELLEMENLSQHLMGKELESTASLFEKADFAKLTAKIGRLRRLQHTEGFNPALLQKSERELCKRFVVLNHVPIIVQVSRLFANSQNTQSQTRDLLHQMRHSISDSRKFLRTSDSKVHWRVLKVMKKKKSTGADVMILTAGNQDSGYSGIGVSGNQAMDFSNQP